MTARPQSSGLPNVGQDVANLGLVRPPLVYLTSLVTGALIHLATPFPLLPGSLAAPVGAFFVVVSVALFSYSVAKFRAGYQSRLLRASRETSSPNTAPTRPRLTSATRR